MHIFRGKRTLCLVAAVGLLLSACSGSGSSKDASSKADKTAASTVPNVTPATQIIANVVPAGAQRIHLEAGPIDIKPGQNDISYQRTIPQPKISGYMVGFTSNLRYADGTVPPVDVLHLHHGVWLNLANKDATSPGLPERFYAAGEEKTRELIPTGYGYKYNADTDHWLLNYMLHNQLSKPTQVWVTYDADIVPTTSPVYKTIKPAIPVWMDVQNGSIYPVFDVIQGSGTNGQFTYPDDDPSAYKCPAPTTTTTVEGQRRHRRGPVCNPNEPPKNEWVAPYDGTLLATAGHVHPGGLHDDLWDTRAGATGLPGHTKPGASDTAHLFSSVSSYFEPAGGVSWDVSMSATPADWKVSVKKGDTLSISSTYDSKTASWYESMGIMIVWMTQDPAANGKDPFTSPVDVKGVLTHGHLAENDNHGGQPDPSNYADMTKLQPKVMPSGTVLPIADFAYQGDMSSEPSSIPAVVQGGSLVFDNKDAAQGVPHTITACDAPCDKSTGIAYPLANGQPQFDSGELARIGVPSNGMLQWATPTNLPPGVYTYFCRIHPFMRGAFAVVPKSSS